MSVEFKNKKKYVFLGNHFYCIIQRNQSLEILKIKVEKFWSFSTDSLRNTGIYFTAEGTKV